MFSSLQSSIDSKKKRLHVTFTFLQTKYLSDGRVNERVAKVEDLNDLLQPGATDGFSPFLMNSSCI